MENNNNIIVYDTCNVDSVIGAALLQEHKDFSAISYDHPEFPVDINATYYWVGVTPTDRQRTILMAAKNVGFCLMPKTDKFYDGVFSLSSITVEDEAFQPHRSILHVVDHYLGDYADKNPGVVWTMGEALERFMRCDKQIEISLQACIWDNYKRAISALTLADTSSYRMSDLITDETCSSYLEFLKSVKKRLGLAWCTSNVKIGKDVAFIPVVNLEVDVTPWAMKLAANTHDRVMIFHSFGTNIYASVFSRDGDYGSVKTILDEGQSTIEVTFWY